MVFVDPDEAEYDGDGVEVHLNDGVYEMCTDHTSHSDGYYGPNDCVLRVIETDGSEVRRLTFKQLRDALLGSK